MQKRLVKIGIAVVLLGAVAGGGAAWATRGDDEQSVTGPSADRASAAALAHVRAGRVTGVERDSEGGATWEVEVSRPHGSTVDVRLDADYRVVGVEGDTEDGAGDSGERENDD